MRKSTRFPSVSRRVQPHRDSFNRLRASATTLTGLTTLFFGAALVPQAEAGPDAWSTAPGSNTFTGINWTTGTTIPGAPTGTIVAGDDLYFGTSTIVALNNDEAAGFSINSFNFNAGASAYTITGNSFALGAGGITNNSTSLQTINDAFTVAGTSTFTTTAGGGNLALGGAISGGGGLTKTGAGTLTLTGSSTFTGATNVNGGTLVLGANSGLYNFGGNAGVINVNSGGTLQFSRNDSIGGSAGPSPVTVTVTGGTLTNSTGSYTSITSANFNGGTIIDNGGAQAGYAAFRLGGTVTIGGTTATNFNVGTVVTTGNVNGINLGVGNSNDTTTFNVGDVTGDATSDLNVNDILRNSGNSTTGNGLTKTGAGTMTLTAANLYTGLTTISAGTLATTTAGVIGNITNNSALVFDQTLPTTALVSGTYAGVISGTGTVAKNNAGTAILNGANTYSGATAVNGGILYVNGSLSTASAISVANGARLGGTGTVGTATIAAGGSVEGGQNNAGRLTLSGLTFSGAGTAIFGNLANYTTTPAIAAGALTANGGANSVALTINGTIPGAGTYQLISYTGGAIGGTGQSAFTLGTLPNRATGNLVFTTGLIALNVTGSDFLIWTGGATNTWDTTNPNFKLNSNGQAATYINNPGDSVVFDDTAGAAHTTVNLNSGNLTPTSVTFNNSALNYTLQGASAITGVTGLTKTGTGTLTINNNNTYTGLTAINGGILSLGSAGAVGTTSTISFGGGTLQYSANNTTDYSSRFSTAANQAYSIDTNGQTVAFASTLNSVGGSLTKSGAGTLTLSSYSTLLGGTTVNGGTLELNRGGQTGTVQGPITVNAGATLSLTVNDALGYDGGNFVPVINVNGGTVTAATATFNEGYLTAYNLTGGTVNGAALFRFSPANPMAPAALGITSNASATTSVFDARIDDFTGNLTFNVAKGTTATGTDLRVSGVIGGVGGLIKNGAGTMMLTAANTYTGATTVNAGSLIVTGSTTLGSAVTVNNAGSVFGGTGNVGGTVTIGNGAVLTAGNNMLNAPTTGALSTGPLTLQTGSTFNALVVSGTNFSSLTAFGTTVLTNAAFSISLANGATFVDGTVLQLVIASDISDTQFTNTTYTVGGYQFTADYTTDPGFFDVDVRAVPEPASWAGFLLVGLVGVSRRQKLKEWLRLARS